MAATPGIYKRINGTWVLLGVGQAVPDTTPPSNPTNLQVTAHSTTSFSVSWSPSTDAGGSGLDRYETQIGASTAPWATNGLSTSRTFSGLTAGTAYAVRVRAVDAAGNVSGILSGTVSTDAGTPPPQPVGLFAGHVPNRVLVGMAASESGRPTTTEAAGIVGKPIYVLRRFTQGNITRAALLGHLSDADALGSLCISSFKYGDWAGVAAGNFDADLDIVRTVALERKKAGQRPFLFTIHHEPAGDGPLDVWANMQLHLVNYFKDIKDAIAISPIGNGFWWRPATPQPDADVAWPQKLIDALRVNGGVILNDFYDADYVDMQAAKTDPTKRVAGTGVRTSTRIKHFMTWARAHNAGAVGCGEFGCIDGAELSATMQVMFANRDLWAVSNYFNSFANSDHDWRLIPANYPAYNGTNSKGYQDFGGDSYSAGRLAAFQKALTDSISSTYTAPL